MVALNQIVSEPQRLGLRFRRALRILQAGGLGSEARMRPGRLAPGRQDFARMIRTEVMQLTTINAYLCANRQKQGLPDS